MKAVSDDRMTVRLSRSDIQTFLLIWQSGDAVIPRLAVELKRNLWKKPWLINENQFEALYS